MLSINQTLAQELNVREQQVAATVALLDEGASVPFIARYRKEVTGALDDTQLRQLAERLQYLRELADRRTRILASIEEQGQLTPELQAHIQAADTKQALEDLYLPYRPKRRTKAQNAREAGLMPLVEILLAHPHQDPQHQAQALLEAQALQPLTPEATQVTDVKAALEGAKQILMEQFAETPALVGALRQRLAQEAVIVSKAVADPAPADSKFSDYFAYQEALAQIPSHRALALLRGRNEGVLQLSLALPEALALGPKDVHPCEIQIAQHFNLTLHQLPAWWHEVVRWTWRVKLAPQLETELIQQMREAAEEAAIQVFAANLKDLLLAAPAGGKVTLGLDPGLRTGIKVALVDANGHLLTTSTLYPHAPQNRWQEAKTALVDICRRYQVALIAIGNGTASRETDRLAAEVVAELAAEQPIQKVMVSEAGASVYSASELAAQEFPDLDVTLRGAVSIARRLQDPLAELVKIEPKSIGVGQYQHDVSQVALARTLDAVVEDCVNAVGVELNTASVPLLTRVSGLNARLAAQIVAWREQAGGFSQRRQLLKVKGLGPKTFEQCAGFLRIRQGEHPLDASGVHPEAYSVVEAIAHKHQRPLGSLIGDVHFLRTLQPQDYINDHFGLPTLIDILHELEKPGRDPRPEFTFAHFREGVESLADLSPGMRLEGVVTNVTHFGAFVDIGVHQDGLVHISELADHFVSDPRTCVKAGDIVQVRVLDLDQQRKRISLSMRSPSRETPVSPAKTRSKTNPKTPTKASERAQPLNTGLAAALQKALKTEAKSH